MKVSILKYAYKACWNSKPYLSPLIKQYADRLFFMNTDDRFCDK